VDIIHRLLNRSKSTDIGRSVELEISTRCPVRCPLCPRTEPLDGDNSWNTGFLDKKVLIDFVKESAFKDVIFCGGYGDPIYHPDFIEIIESLGRLCPDMDILVETNGSYMKREWWEKLGRVTTARHKFSFSIDGLEDTNHLYRVNADWKTIIEGIDAFRKHHKGIMQWKWILFSYNQDQVLEGYRASKKMGFDMFKLIDSNRHNEDTRPTINFAQAEDLIRQEKIKAIP
jgi:MoaA/NifB/PqqE/SkfB family radical SAM enzyme